MKSNKLRLAAALAAVGAIGAGIAVPALSQQGQAPAQPPAQAQGQAQAPAAEDPVVARLNDAEVRRSEVLELIGTMPPQIRQMPMELVFPAMLDQLLSIKLLAAAGYAQGLQDSEEVKARVRQAEERAVQEAYLAARLDSAVTEEALRTRYQRFVEENPPQDEVRASHILVGTEEEAKRIIADVAGGADFAAIAREKSIDPGSGPQGGDLGYFQQGDMVQPFADAAFTITPGSVGQSPVETQFGWHVIKVVDRRQATTPAFEEVQPQLRQEVQQEAITDLLQELRSGARIERFAMDGTPLPEGQQPRR
jgi:peptidyl-prolyl cis-trans isomerase C